MPSLTRSQLDWLILLCIDIGGPAMLVWKRHTGEITVLVGVISAIIVQLVLNGAVALAVYRRNNHKALRTARGFFIGVASMAILSALVTALAVAQVPAHNDFLRLALSDTPLEKIQPVRDRLVVELIRRRAANSRVNDQLIAEARKNPLSPQLYTPESFANLEVIQRTSSGLKRIVDADLDYGAKQLQVMADFRGKMKQVDPEYLKSWDAKTNDQEALMAETMVVQKQMLDSVLALYGFTAKHTAAFKLSGDKLEITDPSIKQEFASQFTASKTQYNKMVEQVQKAAKQQQDARSRSADISH